jgi:hypothetical protein
VAIVALTAMWRHPEAPPERTFMPVVVLVVVVLSVAVQLGINIPPPQPDTSPAPPPTVLSQSEWTLSAWQRLPCYRSDMDGDHREPLSLQWAAESASIRGHLRARGWIEGTDVSAHSLLSLASPDVAAVSLPVLPKLNNGVPSSLVFMRPGDTRAERDVLRFWPSGYAVKNGVSATPVWVGSFAHERLSRPTWPLNILRVDRAVGAFDAHPRSHDGFGAQVLARVDCHGVAVSLLAAPVE